MKVYFHDLVGVVIENIGGNSDFVGIELNLKTLRFSS
jgi:hypothetical protein